MKVLLLLFIGISLSEQEKEPNRRIVGGKPIDITQAPYQVSLRKNGFHHCGGSIISETWILSAAHCTYKQKTSAFSVCLGTSYHRKCEQLIPVTRVIDHEGFNPMTVDYDINVIELKKPIQFNAKAAIIGLPEADAVLEEGTKCFVTGWGDTQSWFESSHKLRGVEVPVVSQEFCNSAYKMVPPITNRMLCAGYKEGGKDACFGDSGGPLRAKKLLYGVVSFGSGCAYPTHPGVYTRVASVRGWIKENTGI